VESEHSVGSESGQNYLRCNGSLWEHRKSVLTVLFTVCDDDVLVLHECLIVTRYQCERRCYFAISAEYIDAISLGGGAPGRSNNN